MHTKFFELFVKNLAQSIYWKKKAQSIYFIFEFLNCWKNIGKFRYLIVRFQFTGKKEAQSIYSPDFCKNVAISVNFWASSEIFTDLRSAFDSGSDKHLKTSVASIFPARTFLLTQFLRETFDFVKSIWNKTVTFPIIIINSISLIYFLTLLLYIDIGHHKIGTWADNWTKSDLGGMDGGLVKKTQKTSDIINGCSLKPPTHGHPCPKCPPKDAGSASVPVKGKLLLVLGGCDGDNSLATSEYVSPDEDASQPGQADLAADGSSITSISRCCCILQEHWWVTGSERQSTRVL